jgi:DNA-binding transcriptional ArsR family regulator
MTSATKQLDITTLQQASAQACGLLKILANPDRLLLLCRISQGELCVGDLEMETGIRQPTLSQQLTVLREEQLVATRREGKQIFYSLSSKEAIVLIQALHNLYCLDIKNRKGTRN